MNHTFDNDIDDALARAEIKCAETGGRLTPKRTEVLKVLLMQENPLSAYEITHEYNQSNNSTIQPMSVYRILDFLVNNELVHKLESTNKYLPCSHISCNHRHHVPQFLICRKCSAVKEINFSRKLIDELSHQVRESAFQLVSAQLELDCICHKCVQESLHPNKLHS